MTGLVVLLIVALMLALAGMVSYSIKADRLEAALLAEVERHEVCHERVAEAITGLVLKREGEPLASD